MISQANIWVAYDTVQMTRRDWRARNKIISGAKTEWLTIPTVQSDRVTTRICDSLVHFDGHSHWADRHRTKIEQGLEAFPYFEEFAEQLEDSYRSVRNSSRLIEVTIPLSVWLIRLLSIDVEVVVASKESRIANALANPNRSERLLEICNSLGASRYITTPKALSYLDTGIFQKSNIDLEILDFADWLQFSNEQYGEPVSTICTVARQGIAATKTMIRV